MKCGKCKKEFDNLKLGLCDDCLFKEMHKGGKASHTVKHDKPTKEKVKGGKLM